ncbi:MAG: potassium-transporting ATPase subunit KdpC [Methylococcaceae bacterium]|nr:potassium-transporting ATPase subunit KdpC [Prolixibacteraceae bacterium]
MKTQILIAIKIFTLFTILLGIAYPMLITTIGQIAFTDKANGSLIKVGNKVVGSELIGQTFDSDLYFYSRPSATNYNPLPSGGSNLGPTSEKRKQLAKERKENFILKNQIDPAQPLPSEMLCASASGLDPHISPPAALMQVERIVKARQLNGMQKQELLKTIAELTEAPQFSLFGEARINVLRLNLALDKFK